MKRLLLFVLLTVVLVACAPVATNFVALPEYQKLAITGIFIAVLALVLDFAIGKLPWLVFFRQYQEVWATGVAIAFTNWLENALPTGTENLSISAVGLLIAAALYFLGRTALRRKGVASFVKQTY